MSGKRFLGAPFGTQSSRFDISGVYPAQKKIGTFTEINHCKRLTGDLERRLGPGKYEVDPGAFSAQAVQNRAKGPGWRREQETSQQAQMPHMLYRDAWKAQRLLNSKMGPGRYSLPEFTELLERKPCSVRGVCDSREGRLKDYMKKTVPGPGSYGKGGIPSQLLDEKRRRPTGTCQPMDFSAGVERFPEQIVDSGLCPGTYYLKTCAELMLSRCVSKRGPYDVFTGRRDKPICCGYFAAPKKANLNPGKYFKLAKVFGEDLQHPDKRQHGLFGSLDQYPKVPTERIYLDSLAQCPRPASLPGPGYYDVTCLSRVESQDTPPFLSSSPRISKRAERQQQGNYTSVGPGRYNIAKKCTKSQTTANAGHRHIFKSSIPRYLHDLDHDTYTQERLRPINIPPGQEPYHRPPDQALGGA